LDDVNLHIDELVIDHPAATSAHHALDALPQPLVDRLGVPMIAEIRRAVSAALQAGSEG
jgi:hypothetical protein